MEKEQKPARVEVEKEVKMNREELIKFEAARRNHAPLYLHSSCASELEMDGYGEWMICPTHGRVSAIDRSKNPRHAEEYQRMLVVVEKEFEEEEALRKKKDAEYQAIEDRIIQYTLENCPKCKGTGAFTNRFGETLNCHHKW